MYMYLSIWIFFKSLYTIVCYIAKKKSSTERKNEKTRSMILHVSRTTARGTNEKMASDNTNGF